MKIRKIGDNLPKVLIFSGSPRDKSTCPNMGSKTQKIVDYMTSKWSPFIQFDVVDLSVNPNKRPTIQPCKGCISTSGGYHCHFPCSCFVKGSKKQPDFLKDEDVYSRLQECDAFLIVSPIHWYSLSSQIKLLFDRLVCINQTLSVDDAKNIMGSKNIKNSAITGKFSTSGEFDNMLKNHLEGKVAGFYVQGDDGGDDYSDKDLPETYTNFQNSEFTDNPVNFVMPFVMQLRYSGVLVPDNLIESFFLNKGVNYYQANMEFEKESEFFKRADSLIENLLNVLDDRKLSS